MPVRDGSITLCYGPEVVPADANQIRIMPLANGKPTDLSAPSSTGKAITWSCTAAGLTTVEAKFLPRECP